MLLQGAADTQAYRVTTSRRSMKHNPEDDANLLFQCMSAGMTHNVQLVLLRTPGPAHVSPSPGPHLCYPELLAPDGKLLPQQRTAQRLPSQLHPSIPKGRAEQRKQDATPCQC